LTPSKRIALIVGVIVIAVVAPLFVLFIWTPSEEVKPVVFEEFDEILIDIDASGNASCQCVAQLTPSKLADFMNYLAPLIGIDEMEQNYVESLRNDFARYGLEMRNPSCEVTTTKENFGFTIMWEMPAVARWRDDRWTVTLDWIDNQSSAKEVIAGERDSWILTRNIAETYGIQYAQYKISSKTTLVLPENAENVDCPLLGSSQTIDHGGGTYSTSSLYIENIDGRAAVVENGLTLIVAESEITLTPQQLLENSLFYPVNYNGAPPENATFLSSVEQVRLDLKYGRELEEQYSIYGGQSWYSLSPAQVLYYVSWAIDNYNQGGQFSIQQPISVTAPGSEGSDWGACWENLSKNEYVSLAQAVRDNISHDNEAPGEVETSVGKIRFRDALYTFTRVLSSYKESGELPSVITFAPAPTGEITLADDNYSAELAYFLLPDTHVITDTVRVNGVLDNIRDNRDNRELAEEICNWANTNISYNLVFNPPTSEEVLESKQGQCRDYTNVYLALTRTAGMPARRMNGWVVSEWQPPAGWEFIVGKTPEGETIGGHAWAQAYLPGEGWTAVDPTAGWFGNLEHEIYQQQEQTWMGALAGYETAYELI